MLDHIISKLVFCQRVDVYKNLFEYRSALELVTILQNALDHSAAISMDAELIHILSHGLYHKIDDLSWHFFDTFLNDMIPILVIDAFND
jgi:hypothetical protein